MENKGRLLQEKYQMKEPNLLVVGMESDFVKDVYERLINAGLSISWYFSMNRVSSESSLNISRFIDFSCFYQASSVASAYELNELSVLDKGFLSSMVECERYFMSTMDRFSAKPQSMVRRKVIFRELLRFFKTFFEKYIDITHVFFPATPHSGWDVVLFFVAKHFGITTLILDRTDLNDLHLIKEDWRCKLNIVRPDCSQQIVESNRFDTLLSKDSEYIKWYKLNQPKTNGKYVFGPRGFQKFVSVLYSTHRWIRLFINSYRLSRGPRHPGFFYSEKVSSIEICFLYIKKYILNKKGLSECKRLSVYPDLSVPYIYYALHYQPERTTAPEGMEYEDQFLAIATLAAALPHGWRLYVKEHPKQFDRLQPDLNKIHARPVNYYNEIASIPKVDFVVYDFDSETLILNSRMCSTVTGTVGWQALKNGKPAITFGYPWYSACESCAVIGSVEDAESAIDRLSKMDKDAVNKDVRAFLQVLEPHLFLSCFQLFLPGNWSNEDPQGYANSLSSNLLKRIQGKLPLL